MENVELKEKMAETIRNYHLRGWSPATSTNYSFLDEKKAIWVSRSGVDKSQFTTDDFITVDKKGNATGNYATVKPSAETLIHCVLYDLIPETGVILHSHSVFPVLIASIYQNEVMFEGYELQKGFAGETTHENKIYIPIFDNTQNMPTFAETLKENKEKLNHHCFIMRGHGIYAWGANLFEAKRHLETLEYLSEILYRNLIIKYNHE